MILGEMVPSYTPPVLPGASLGKPVKLRPLQVPVGFERLDHRSADFSLKELRRLPLNETVVLVGKPEILSATSNNALVGRIHDEQGHYIVFKTEPMSEWLRAFLEPHRTRLIHFSGQLRTAGDGLVFFNPVPLNPAYITPVRPRFSYHTNLLHSRCDLYQGLHPGNYLADARVQHDIRAGLRDNLDRHIAASTHLLFKDGLKSTTAIRCAVGTASPRHAKLIVDQLLRNVLSPRDIESATAAHAKLEFIAAICLLHDRIEQQALMEKASRQEQHDVPTLGDLPINARRELFDSIAARLGVPFTEHQTRAAIAILKWLDEGIPMRALLTGDVGTGKTAVYALTAAAMFERGYRVAVILPSEPVARQVHQDFATWLPQSKPALVCGSVSKNTDSRIVIGTTAVHTRVKGDFDYIIVDEQQRFGTRQRMASLAKNGHLLEVTATCIPRSHALLQMGLMRVARIEKGHVEKRIVTRIWTAEQRQALFADIQETLNYQGQVLAIYPAKQPTKSDIDDLDHYYLDSKEERSNAPYSATDFFERWHSLYPGRVVMVHGGLTSQQNAEAIQKFRSGEAWIMVATSIVEVGLNIPNLNRVCIVQADRFGASNLHQFRGRAARNGGLGYCDLYLPTTPTSDAMRKLEVVARTNNGFEIAEADCIIRGSGDVTESGQRQKGKLPPSPMYGMNISNETLLAASDALRAAFGLDTAGD